MATRLLVGIVLLAASAVACSPLSRGRNLLNRLWKPRETPAAETFSLEIPAPPEVIPASPLRALAPPAPSGAKKTEEFRREPVSGPIPELRTAYFDFDSAELTEEAKESLRVNAEWLLENVELEVQVQGHCDERGTVEYNFNLGQRRADAVRAFLMGLGVPKNRIHTISYGEERPVATEHNEEAWRQNRRTEFHVY